MKNLALLLAALGIVPGAPGASAADAPLVKPRTMADVIAASKPSDWRSLDPQNTLYLELAAGRVVIELAPAFAPRHVANIKALVHEHYFDGLPIERSQDNYVVQWGDPDNKRAVRNAQKTLAAEFSRTAKDLNFSVLPDPDTYAPEVGFVDGFPAAREPRTHTAWLVHCYSMVGAGRDNDVDSGGGTELYAVIGQAPRQLDRNVTLVGRVVSGVELLSTMRRGTGPLGFYEKPAERTAIQSMRLAQDVPESQRSQLEVMRTDTQTFADLVETRRNRRDEWYKVPAGRIDVCNVPLVVRPRP
jgi:peptidylprolyl isomerase